MAVLMQPASRESLAAATKRLDSYVDGAGPADPQGRVGGTF
jgi:hypothetical protein